MSVLGINPGQADGDFRFSRQTQVQRTSLNSEALQGSDRPLISHSQLIPTDQW